MNNRTMSNHQIALAVQESLNARQQKAQDAFDASQQTTQKIADGLRKILGENPERVLRNLPSRSPRRRWGGGGQILTDHDKLKMLTRAVLRDFKLVKCSRIAELLHSRTGKSMDCADLQRIPNSVLDAIERTVSNNR